MYEFLVLRFKLQGLDKVLSGLFFAPTVKLRFGQGTEGIGITVKHAKTIMMIYLIRVEFNRFLKVLNRFVGITHNK
ncbi:MAG TPA: hypothetical protein PKC25_02105, partial [Candidatus Rifleibacterium sp.]|nr:hypothetical protein [Candidatus Rifleibacterium sp.]